MVAEDVRCCGCSMLLMHFDTTSQECVKEAQPDFESNTQLLAVDHHLLPDWIRSALNQAAWRVGKIQCLKCLSTVGGFNFLTASSLPLVYFLRHKVIINPARMVSAGARYMGHHKKSLSWFAGVSDVSRKSSHSMSQVVVPPPSRSATPVSLTDESVLSENGDIPDHLTCSVCLELLCRPRLCMPCEHLFCSLCLHYLYMTTPEDERQVIGCPLCRQTIHFTLEDAGVETECVRLFPVESARKLELERPDAIRKIVPGSTHLARVYRLMEYVHTFSPTTARFLAPVYDITYRVITSLTLNTLATVGVVILCLIFFFMLFVPSIYFTVRVIDWIRIELSARGALDNTSQQSDDSGKGYRQFLQAEKFFELLLNTWLQCRNATLFLMRLGPVGLMLVFTLISVTFYAGIA